MDDSDPDPDPDSRSDPPLDADSGGDSPAPAAAPTPGGPPSGVLAHWEDVMADVEATADEYREAGWDVLTLHPGDVRPVPHAAAADDAGLGDGRPLGADPAPDADAEQSGDSVDDGPAFVGLDVVVPGDEFEQVESAVGEVAFDEYEVYRSQRGGVVFLVIVMLAEESGRAVVVPAYYATTEATDMVEAAREAGTLETRVRPLTGDRHVVFTQSSPAPLLPAEPDAG